jgi:hypothetical protein
MKRKPTNVFEFLRTVALVQHPNLDMKHRLLLHNLALFANPAGCGAYPGSDYLEKVMGRSWKRINAYAKQLEGFGLLVRTQVGRKGRNTEWNFCLDNPAYPDIDGQQGDDLNADIGGHISPSLGGQNTGVLGGQTSNSLDGHRRDQPTTTSTKPTTTTTTGSGVVPTRKPATIVEPRPSLTPTELREARERVLEVFIRAENETPVTTARQDKELESLIKNHGEDKVAAALKLDLRTPAYYTTKSGERTRLPLARFLKSSTLLIREATIAEARRLKPADIALATRVARIRHGLEWSNSLTDEQKQFLRDISFQSSEADLDIAGQIVSSAHARDRKQAVEPTPEDFLK